MSLGICNGLEFFTSTHLYVEINGLAGCNNTCFELNSLYVLVVIYYFQKVVAVIHINK